MSELKPCPFCGSKPRTYTVSSRYVDTERYAVRWKVMCGREDCCILLNDFANEGEAIAAWNRRAGQ